MALGARDHSGQGLQRMLGWIWVQEAVLLTHDVLLKGNWQEKAGSPQGYDFLQVGFKGRGGKKFMEGKWG